MRVKSPSHARYSRRKDEGQNLIVNGSDSHHRRGEFVFFNRDEGPASPRTDDQIREKRRKKQYRENEIIRAVVSKRKLQPPKEGARNVFHAHRAVGNGMPVGQNHADDLRKPQRHDRQIGPRQPQRGKPHQQTEEPRQQRGEGEGRKESEPRFRH